MLRKAFGDGAVPLPSTVLFDGHGVVVRTLTGQVTREGLEGEVRKLLAR